jgi:hypothetical protein
MKAHLSLTSFRPEEFQDKVGILKPSVRINQKGKFSFTKEAIKLLGLADGMGILVHQHSEHTGIWFLQIDKKGWKIKGLSKNASLGFNSKGLKNMIYECFGITDEETGFSLIIHEEPIITDEKKEFWILYAGEPSDYLDPFLESLNDSCEKEKEGTRVNGSRRRRASENAFGGPLN